MVELRYRGNLFQKFNNEKEIVDYTIHRWEHENIVELDWTVESDRPFAVHCNGQLIETFNTGEEAQLYISSKNFNNIEYNDSHPRYLFIPWEWTIKSLYDK